MKAFLALIVLVSVSAQAKSIPSLSECHVEVRSDIRTGTFKVESSRLSGNEAVRAAKLLRASGARLEKNLDVLGVMRYETLTSNKTLSVNGTEINSCEGVYTATASKICTASSEKTICETFCHIDWRGQDCR